MTLAKALAFGCQFINGARDGLFVSTSKSGWKVSGDKCLGQELMVCFVPFFEAVLIVTDYESMLETEYKSSV